MKILMVCLGNICRSPLAESILRYKCKQKGLDWEIDSAGTGNWNLGSPADRRSVNIAKKYGVAIADRSARKVNSSDYSIFDMIFAMDLPVYQALLKWAIDAKEEAKIKMIMDEVYPGEVMNVPDPYFDDDGFEKVYHMLDEACDAIIKKYG